MGSIVGVQRIQSGTLRVLGEEGGAPSLRAARLLHDPGAVGITGI